MSWMDSWSRPAKHQATPVPYYLIPGSEDTPYCHSCGRVISSRRTPGGGGGNHGANDSKTPVKYCSSRCRSHKPGKLDREIEDAFVGFLTGELGEEGGAAAAAAAATTKKGSNKKGAGKKTKGDNRILVPCGEVEHYMFERETEDDDNQDNDKNDKKNSKTTDMIDEGVHLEDTDLTDTEPSHLTQTWSGEHAAALEKSFADSLTLSGDKSSTLDYDVVARMSVRSGTRIRPPQHVSEVNGSVGGEKGRAERIDETDEMLEKRREGMRKTKHKEMVKCAARRGVVFGFLVGGKDGEGERRKCEAVMNGKVVEPSYAKGNWKVRWRE
ncbi:hypothetical protein BD289DRAFT_485384 [Coniella lustricola]|uniref:Uncharacterized protein n=1 Tax=Coniella lustricola TaxID=2025994 RepID=A0A2T2ZYV2_9PEZI|nr:hypothetical protein BD289DRAFT_485384 [Coniella lustricola]